MSKVKKEGKDKEEREVRRYGIPAFSAPYFPAPLSHCRTYYKPHLNFRLPMI